MPREFMAAMDRENGSFWVMKKQSLQTNDHQPYDNQTFCSTTHRFRPAILHEIHIFGGT